MPAKPVAVRQPAPDTPGAVTWRFNARLAAPYLHTWVTVGPQEVVVRLPHALAGAVPAGHRTVAVPVAAICGVRSSWRIYANRAVLLIAFAVGWVFLVGPWWALLGAPVALWLALGVATPALTIDVAAGRPIRAPFCVLERFDAELVSADIAGMRHAK